VARVYVCDDCRGTGAIGFAKGPAVERCTRCEGVGVLFPEPATAARDLRDAVLRTSVDERFLELGTAWVIRALASSLARVEERLARLEAELDRRR
jgi:hypothetical protein